MFQKGGEWCQEFEAGTLCESGLQDNRSAAERAIDNRAVELGSKGASPLYNLCGSPVKYYSEVVPGQAGFIFYVNGTAVKLHGGIGHTYDYQAAKCATFGVPTVDASETGDKNGWYQTFFNGSIYTDIYWHKSEAKAQGKWVTGSIRNYYNVIGGSWSEVGYPTNQSINATSACQVSGQHQEFQNGKIYSSSLATTHLLYNDWMYHYWNSGEVEGSYGWPVSGLTVANGLETQEFEAGDMYGRSNGINWWIEDRVVGCMRKSVEREYGIKLVDGQAVWSDEELAQISEAFALVPRNVYEDYLEEIVRDSTYQGRESVAGLTDPESSGRKIHIYDSASYSFIWTVVHELMHVYQFKYGGQNPISYKQPTNEVIENYYTAAGFEEIDCSLNRNRQICSVRNMKYEYTGDCSRMQDFVSEYARIGACGTIDDNYWEEMAESMTYFLIDQQQFSVFNGEVDWPSSDPSGHYDGEAKLSDVLNSKYNHIQQYIF